MDSKLSAPSIIPSRRKFLSGAAALGGSAAILAAVNDGARAAGDPIPVGQAAPLT
jgi:branched-chain amino acid transport system substrate-binding protein